MRFYFVTNVFKWGRFGGPQSRAKCIIAALQRFADFPYEVLMGIPTEFKVADSDMVHVQSNRDLVVSFVRMNAPLIVGPNFQWQSAAQEILQYSGMRAVLLQRPDPVAKNQNPVWIDRVRFLPAFFDDEFWQPSPEEKRFDVLTIGKSFAYPEYLRNLALLQRLLNKRKLKHFHLNSFTPEEYRSKLAQSRVLAYPSPREAGASLANALLEASAMNVPVVGLKSVLRDEYGEWDASRGIRVETIEEMVDAIPDLVEKSPRFTPRDWSVQNYGLRAGYERFRTILDEVW